VCVCVCVKIRGEGAHPRLLGRLVLLAQLLEPVLLFLSQIGVLLLFGLVEAVDDGVFPLGDYKSLDLCYVSRFVMLWGRASIPFCCP